jgi:hypothetical protein
MDPLTDLAGGNLLTPRLLLRSWRDEDEPSIAVMRRLGMRRSLEFDHPNVPEGHLLRRHVLHRLSADEWREREG